MLSSQHERSQGYLGAVAMLFLFLGVLLAGCGGENIGEGGVAPPPPPSDTAKVSSEKEQNASEGASGGAPVQKKSGLRQAIMKDSLVAGQLMPAGYMAKRRKREQAAREAAQNDSSTLSDSVGGHRLSADSLEDASASIGNASSEAFEEEASPEAPSQGGIASAILTDSLLKARDFLVERSNVSDSVIVDRLLRLRAQMVASRRAKMEKNARYVEPLSTEKRETLRGLRIVRARINDFPFKSYRPQEGASPTEWDKRRDDEDASPRPEVAIQMLPRRAEASARNTFGGRATTMAVEPGHWRAGQNVYIEAPVIQNPDAVYVIRIWEIDSPEGENDIVDGGLFSIKNLRENTGERYPKSITIPFRTRKEGELQLFFEWTSPDEVPGNQALR